MEKIQGALFFSLIFALSNLAEAQENKAENKNSFAISLGHMQVSKGVENNSKKWLALPSWAFDYNYRISPKWSAGLHNDIVLSDFEVESNADSDVILERKNPLSTMLSVGYSPTKWLMIYAGGGAELAKKGNFALIRFGIEPSVEINEKFELVFGINYDFKIDAYDSFGASLGVAYKF